MSHEIRTPMNGVIGMINLLLDTELQGEQREFAETVKSSAESLLTILNDILDFSKIEAGKLEFEEVDIDLRRLVEETLDLMAEAAQSKGLELVGNLQFVNSGNVKGDPGRLRQILINLLGNAIKFTDSGEVVLRVSAKSTAPGISDLRFEIQDTGVGVAPKVQKKLFQSFTQADGSTSRRYGGTGLGLAICKKLVEMMHGEIGMQSEINRGTCVWFEISLPESLHSIAYNPRKQTPLDTLKALIVDDNATNRKVLSRQLENWNVQSVCVSSGIEALEALKAHHPESPFHVALLDMQMPEMDGLTLAQQIRLDPGLNALSLVVLTSMGSLISSQQRLANGISECLQKPVRQSRLHDCLAEIASNQKTTKIVPIQRTPSDQTSDPIALNSTHYGLRILLAEDNQVNQRVTKIQLNKLGCKVEIAANGQEALEAVKKHDYDLVLMDCQMPVMEGYEATREIRQWEASEKRPHPIHIIALTAHAMEGDRQKCLDCGMNDYVSKPILAAELTTALDAYMRKEK